MEICLRHMTEDDRSSVLEMMRSFYASDAVMTDGSEDIFNSNITACVCSSPYLEGFIFEISDAGGEPVPAGYAMLAHSYSTEFGKPCVWIEDLYVVPEARGLGIGRELLDHVSLIYSDAVHRLEAERENRRALEIYRRSGFDELPYMELIRNR